MIHDWKRRLIFWIGAISVALAAILFAVASEWADNSFHKLLGVSPYLPLLITPLGFALIVYLTRKYFPGSQGSGIPQTIAALDPKENSEIRERVLSLRVAFGKILLTVSGFFFGASVGREGPTVQIGASIMHSLGRFTRFPQHDMDKGLILAGAAAGLAQGEYSSCRVGTRGLFIPQRPEVGELALPLGGGGEVIPFRLQ